MDVQHKKPYLTSCCDLDNNLLPVAHTFSLHTHHMTEQLVNFWDGLDFGNATGVTVAEKECVRKNAGGCKKVQLPLFLNLLLAYFLFLVFLIDSQTLTFKVTLVFQCVVPLPPVYLFYWIQRVPDASLRETVFPCASSTPTPFFSSVKCREGRLIM